MSRQAGGPEFFGQAPVHPPSPSGAAARVAPTTKRQSRFRSLLASITKPILSCIMPSHAAAPAPAANHDNEQLNDIFDPKSGIANAENIHRAVANPYYWSKLSEEDRIRILSLWPDQNTVIYAGTTKAVLDFDVIKVNRDLRVNARQYSEDHAAGRHEPEWLASAERAHVNRAEGMYDEMRADHIERQFGVPVIRKDKGKAKVTEVHVQQPQNGSTSPSSVRDDQQAGSVSEVTAVAQRADKDNQNTTEDESESKSMEDEIVVKPQASKQEGTMQQKSNALQESDIQHEPTVQEESTVKQESTIQQEPAVQQNVAVQESVAAENATVEPEQTVEPVQVASTENDTGDPAEDASPEVSPSTRSGVLRRSKRQCSRSNPISRSSSG